METHKQLLFSTPHPTVKVPFHVELGGSKPCVSCNAYTMAISFLSLLYNLIFSSKPEFLTCLLVLAYLLVC